MISRACRLENSATIGIVTTKELYCYNVHVSNAFVMLCLQIKIRLDFVNFVR